MKKERFVALVLIIALMATVGCKEENPLNTSESPKEANVQQIQDVFLDFMSGKIKIKVINSNINRLEPDKKYSYDETNAAVTDYFDVNAEKVNITNAEYAFIDCGDDGIPEIALSQTFLIESDEVELVSIFKLIDGELCIVSSTYGYYRTSVDVNRYGYITSCGSSGGSSIYSDYSFVNGDGEEIFLYSESFETGLAGAYIDSYDFPEHTSPAGYPEDIYSNEDDFVICAKYNFTRFTGDDFYDNNFFTFVDAQDNYIEPGPELSRIYRENGIKYYDASEIQRMIREHESSLGVTDKIRDGGAVSWIDFS